jgi:hypothetical protein
MEKKKIEAKKAEAPAKAGGQYKAKVGGNLADGTRFEAGEVFKSLSSSELAALRQMDAIEEIK